MSVDSPTYDWRDVLGGRAENTFLWEWCSATEQDTTPTEFNLFTGLIALGLMASNRISSPDVKPLSANFGLCLVAESGAGKSRSSDHLLDAVRKVDPPANGLGVHIKSSVFSGQMVVKALSNPEGTPVTALFEWGEFSEAASAAMSQGSILKAKIHEVLDHKSIISYESVSQQRMAAHRPFASIITTTQTKAIRKLLRKEDADSGFMNRFLFLMGKPKQQLARGAKAIDFKRAHGKLFEVMMWARTERSLDWDPAADAYWEQVFREYVEPIKARDEDDILTRLDLNLKRIALAFAINERADKIYPQHVVMAALLAPYLVKCYERIVGALLNTENKEIATWLLEKIDQLTEKNGTGPTGRDLNQLYKNKKWDVQLVGRVLDDLNRAGLIVAEHATGKAGRPTYRYLIV